MTAGHRVNLADLERLIEEAAKTLAAVDSRIAEVSRSVDILHVNWDGAAAEKHRVAHDQWINGARGAHEALDALHKAVADAHANYSGTVEVNVGMWPQL
ncbi:WXG100 family type VII secretion target [Nocardia alni]|uniref:WXG100 family type VII secretion target n=1 Tax=Nocardia alni TaxID=2815723 RepID=UPI001C223E28|nr:WXG100 family type VII secretion target [Nocardia alni]